MDDPWDVKSVRQSGHYTSCMKLNGVPLLPPVLSRECRKEMQYYKLLAKEVEKRISILQPYVLETDTESSESKTDASEIPESELNFHLIKEDVNSDFELNKTTTAFIEKSADETLTGSPLHTELYNISSNKSQIVDATDAPELMGFCFNIIATSKNNVEEIQNNPSSPIEVPERDYNCTKTVELLTDVETVKSKPKEKIIKDLLSHSCTGREAQSDPFAEKDVPQSRSSKSFTGSLNNIHRESVKESDIVPKLVRQRSYTLLKPSPQLLAHLEVQSLNTGVEMSCISMSDSLSNLSSPNKKRRSWDLESAKAKWSTMAQELKQKNLTNPIKFNNNPVTRQLVRTTGSPTRSKSVVPERAKISSLTSRPSPKTEPVKRLRKPSPLRNIPSDRTIVKEPILVRAVKEPTSPKNARPNTSLNHKNHPPSPESASSKPQLISEAEDPATKVRELYEKIQKQQLIQMASLVEKQKREQMLLQQVFEEQNNLLFKQLKTICPKSPIEVKEAWGDKAEEAGRGPVSLSQLINHKSPDQSIPDSPISTLTDSNKYINYCDNVLKKSRDISSSLKKQGKSQSLNGTKIQSPRTQPEGSLTRTNSPRRRSKQTSRQLNYDTSGSEREYDPILTDRTNDTMADLNVTFPSDTEESRANHGSTRSGQEGSLRSTDSAIKCMEETIHNSINNSLNRCARPVVSQPTPKQRAAASKIVAYARGYLVRRLMRTARVQTTVQTIRDALLCALQLHREREGIRGADVDLHRRLIQQITAACYSLHDTFIASTSSERCAMIAADRSRRSSLAGRPPHNKHRDVMSQSHTGAFPSRQKRFASAASLMTQSNYEPYNSEKGGRARYMPSPRRRPWR